MKQSCLWLLVVAAVVTACSSTEGLDANGIPMPSSELAMKAGISLDEMGDGYWVFSRKCLECHGAKLPEGEMVAQWHPVISGMAGNAGLSLSEESKILNYVRAASQRKQ